MYSNVTKAENRRGGALGGRSEKKGVSEPENNMSLPTPFWGSLGRLVGASLGKAVEKKQMFLIRHGGAPRGWRHIS